MTSRPARLSAGRPSQYSRAVSPAAYQFLDRWFVPDATPEEVYDVIGDATSYPRWWGDVFLSVTGDEGPPRPGRRNDVVARGFLPYRIRFSIEERALRREAIGDDVDILAFDSSTLQAFDERRRYSDDRVRAPQCVALYDLIKTISDTSAGEAVNRADDSKRNHRQQPGDAG